MKKKNIRKISRLVIGKKGDAAISNEGNETRIDQNITNKTIREEQKINVKVGGKKSSFLSVIAAILIVAGLSWFLFYTGPGQGIWGEIVGGSQTAFSGIANLFSSMWGMITNTDQSFGSWTNPNPVVINQPEEMGVVINSFETTKDVYWISDNGQAAQNDYVIAVGEMKVKNLKDTNTIININCHMDIEGIKDKESSKVEGEVSISGNDGGYSQTAKLNFAGDDGEFRDKGYTVSCRIPKKEAEEKISGSEIKDEKSIYGTIKLNAIYNANTVSVLRIYTVEKELNDYEMGKFRSGLSKEGLLFNDKIRPQTRNGAMDGSIDLKSSQPISEQGTYFITVGLRNTKGWKGELSKLNSIKLITKSGIIINSGDCEDFANDGNLKEIMINNINNEKCRSTNSEIDSECNSRVDINNLNFNCAVSINSLNEGLSYDLLQANFDYEYAIIRNARANFQVVAKSNERKK